MVNVAIRIAVISLLVAASNGLNCDHTTQECPSDESGLFQSKLVQMSSSETTSASLGMRASQLSEDECPKTLPIKCPEGTCLEEGRQCAAQWYQDLRMKRHNVSRSDKSIVSLTYCDANFAEVWPTFISCYKQALGCDQDMDPEVCGSSKPKLVDLGLSQQPGQTGSHCINTEPPNFQQESISLLELPPTGVPSVIVAGVLHQLSLGKDVLRLDSDAFLLDDPMHIFQSFADADIISSPDFVSQTCCDWYGDDAFKIRHPSDPFRKWGFMMNTGLTFIRSNAKTIPLVRRSLQALTSGRTTYEQTALNEELVDLGCTWTEPERLPSGGNSSQNWNVLVTTPLVAKCAEDLKVVVLPYFDMTRSLDQAHRAMSFHTAGDKVADAKTVAAICEKRAARSKNP
jgi:hypothetical protein